jgi:hypothetical protein
VSERERERESVCVCVCVCECVRVWCVWVWAQRLGAGVSILEDEGVGAHGGAQRKWLCRRRQAVQQRLGLSLVLGPARLVLPTHPNSNRPPREAVRMSEKARQTLWERYTERERERERERVCLRLCVSGCHPTLPSSTVATSTRPSEARASTVYRTIFYVSMTLPVSLSVPVPMARAGAWVPLGVRLYVEPCTPAP